MKKYLLDTNILIHFFNKTESIVETVNKLSIGNQVAISHISLAEILVGWSDKRKKEYLSVLYDLFPRIGINDAVSELSAKWRREYKEQDITINLYDTLIAATAKVHDYELVTLNFKDFPMTELKIYKDIQTTAT